MEVKVFNLLFTLFRNKDFISKESLILADVKNIKFWQKLQIFTFILHPVLLHFFDFFILILFHSAISSDHKTL